MKNKKIPIKIGSLIKWSGGWAFFYDEKRKCHTSTIVSYLRGKKFDIGIVVNHDINLFDSIFYKIYFPSINNYYFISDHKLRIVSKNTS